MTVTTASPSRPPAATADQRTGNPQATGYDAGDDDRAHLGRDVRRRGVGAARTSTATTSRWSATAPRRCIFVALLVVREGRRAFRHRGSGAAAVRARQPSGFAGFNLFTYLALVAHVARRPRRSIVAKSRSSPRWSAGSQTRRTSCGGLRLPRRSRRRPRRGRRPRPRQPARRGQGHRRAGSLLVLAGVTAS